MTVHARGFGIGRTGCGKMNGANMTDDWTEVDCKSCLKLYVYPMFFRVPNDKYGRHSNKGFTDRITRDWYPNAR